MRSAASRVIRAGLACAVIVPTIAGCGGPSQVELKADAEDSHQRLLALADEVVDAFVAASPDLNLTLEYEPDRDDRWNECSGGSRDNPASVQWAGTRWLVVEPSRPTAGLLQPIVDEFSSRGWVAAAEQGVDGSRTVSLSRDGYGISATGGTEVPGSESATIGIDVYGPCLTAPEDFAPDGA